MSLEKWRSAFRKKFKQVYECARCGYKTQYRRKICPVCGGAMEYRQVKR